MKGKVYLVGAGPGDPGLITVKGLELIKRADVIVYDFLAEKSLLSHAKEDAEKIYVGKKGGCHTMSQEEINELLVKKAKEEKLVVRLKGGDPFVFGRGGEEALKLSQEGIEFEVVPGVTSGVAVPAYAGIPVTHRKVAVSVAFVTGHEDPTKEKSQINWEGLARGVDTLVFLMGMGNLELIAEKLMEGGRDPETPTAVITWGTRPIQRTVTSTLRDIAQVVKKEGLAPPGIVVVGKVVSLRERINWYEKKPLFGKRVVVTRPLEGPGELRRLLEEEGAVVIDFPTISLRELEVEGLEDILKKDWDYVVFTSRFGVEIFFKKLLREGFDARFFGGKRVVAVGEKTGMELEKRFIKPDLIPEKFTGEDIVRLFEELGVKGKRILIPRAKKGRKELREGLEALGNYVLDLPTYDTVLPEVDEEALEKVRSGQFDAITFTSSQAVRNFKKLMGEFDLRGKVIVSIGPTTTETIKSVLGVEPSSEAYPYTMEGVLKALKEAFLGGRA